MSLEVSPISPSDLEATVGVWMAAFEEGIGAALMNPSDPAVDFPRHVSHLQKDLKEDKENILRIFKCVDTATGEIAGIAEWHFYLREQTDEELDKHLERPKPGDDSYRECDEVIYDWLKGERRKDMGNRAYIYLYILAIRPQYQRKGVGSALLEHGLQQVDEFGLESYLEASMQGKPLYERFGFRVVNEREFDMTVFGKEGTDRNATMLRPAKTVAP
ncbi:acyl-CoA N-acyltransferase [Aulographum hederae CBS 113979]|uniref:Acyl-CoA N-acyltransferase n=1 Tax=Aulographum hederae CBS 113979 TaxID=1176131 RepID=A0A6G1GSD1_9PEZI|nr:acyl-CoA N-acyltransferase [Aulographum hederae CBS 113979]